MCVVRVDSARLDAAGDRTRAASMCCDGAGREAWAERALRSSEREVGDGLSSMLDALLAVVDAWYSDFFAGRVSLLPGDVRVDSDHAVRRARRAANKFPTTRAVGKKFPPASHHGALLRPRLDPPATPHPSLSSSSPPLAHPPATPRHPARCIYLASSPSTHHSELMTRLRGGVIASPAAPA